MTATPATGPEFTPVELNLHTPRSPGVGRVVETRLCTASKRAAGIVRHVAIDVSDTRLAGAFRAGQSFGVLPPGDADNGKPHKVRLYSIASPSTGEDGQGRILATTVKRTIAEHWEHHRLFLGVASNWLCDLQEGEEVHVTGPAGKRFVLPASPAEHDYLFFATGTGIAPFRGMIMELLAQQIPSRIVLVAGTAYATDLLYDAELRALADQHERFTYLTALSRQPQSDGYAPMYTDSRVTAHADLFAPLLASPRTLIYACGIAGMEVGLFARIVDLLGPEGSSGYLIGEPADLASRSEWTRATLHSAVRPTGRVMVEVY